MITKNKRAVNAIELLYKASCFMRLDRERAWIGYAIAFFASLIITLYCSSNRFLAISMVFGAISFLALILMYLSVFIRGGIIRIEVNGKSFNRSDYLLKDRIISDVDRMVAEVRQKRLDACKVLNIDSSSDMDAIKSAYRSMAKKYHPDSGPNNPGAEASFIAVQNAYEYLKSVKD